MSERSAYAIPGRLNLALLTLASAASAGLLAVAAHAPQLWMVIAAALAFSYTANTLFCLMHEGVHGILHPDPLINRWAGRIAAAFFPTSFSIQRAYHLTHHRDNRSERERFDYLQPGESKWLKRAQWYSLLTGLYWAIATAGLLLYLISPSLPRALLLRRRSAMSDQTGARSYLKALESIDSSTARAEILLCIAVQALLFGSLNLTVAAWLVCYAAFALQWSALQYADHAFSPLDPRDGAWNLKVIGFTRALFLNYHHHLAHHRHPSVPWIHLGRLVDPVEPRPRYLRIWLRMWKGPQPLPAPDAS